MVQVWGSYQRFEYSGLSVQLSLSDYQYRVGDGESYLNRIGYDRMPDPDLSVDMFLGYNGSSHIEGPSFATPFKFTWELQFLEPDVYAQIMALIRRSHAAKAPIRFYDALLTLNEVAPRTRARVGSYLETTDGLVWFYPVFDVWIDYPKRQNRLDGRHSLSLEGREWNPRSPIPITEDVAL